MISVCVPSVCVMEGTGIVLIGVIREGGFRGLMGVDMVGVRLSRVAKLFSSTRRGVTLGLAKAEDAVVGILEALDAAPAGIGPLLWIGFDPPLPSVASDRRGRV